MPQIRRLHSSRYPILNAAQVSRSPTSFRASARSSGQTIVPRWVLPRWVKDLFSVFMV